MDKKLSRRSFLKYSLVYSTVTANLLLAETDSFAYKPSKIVVEKKQIYLKNLPSDLENFTIAQISDIHRSELVEPWLIEKTIGLVSAQKADCIVITGDSGNNTAYLKDCFEQLKTLSAPFGVYAITGNWERNSGVKKSVDVIKTSKIIPLSDEYDVIEKNGSKIYLIGVDDDGGIGSNLESTFSNINDQHIKILLCHNPYIVASRKKALKRVDLILSGHTHGGQVVYPLIGALVVPTAFGLKMTSGLYNFEETLVYINRGIGVVKYPYRINCPPEITLITLKNKK